MSLKTCSASSRYCMRSIVFSDLALTRLLGEAQPAVGQLSVELDLAGELADALDAHFVAISVQAVDDFLHDPRVDERGRAHLHRRGTGQHELDRILGAADAAAADDGDVHAAIA